METSKINPYEETGRAVKVMAYVRYLSTARGGRGFTGDEVRAFNIEQWSLAAKGADLHYPSQISQQMIATALDGVMAERARDDDLFDGVMGNR